MSDIQFPYGYVKNNKQIQFNSPTGYEEEQYLKDVPYITNLDPAVKNNLLNLIKNREDLKKSLLGTGPFGNKIQDDVNAIVGFDENFNNEIVRHSMDLKDQALFRNPNPINVTFHDMKKFDLVNPLTGNLATQVNASKLTDYQLTKKLLQQGKIDELQLILDELKYGVDKDDDNKGSGGTGSDGERGGDGGTPCPIPPQTPQQEMKEIYRRLDALKRNTQDVSPYNTRAQSSTIVARKNNEKFVKNQGKKREIANIPKGIVNKKKSTTNFNFPDTPPQMPEEDYWQSVELLSVPLISQVAPFPSAPHLFNYEKDFPPLSRRRTELPSLEPRETSLGDFGTILPLRNKLPNTAPLPSKPSIVNFSRPITQLTDEKYNTIQQPPKKPVLPQIGEKQLSEQLEQFFPDDDQTIQQQSETFKEKTENVEELIDVFTKSDDNSADEQKTFEFEFFTGGVNQRFNSFV